MRIPPRKVWRRLKTDAPISRARKKSFRSTPISVRGRLRERKTGLLLRGIVNLTGMIRERARP
jgi:hypothetical protein